MPELNIPDLDEAIFIRLQNRASAHGWTTDAEAKAILTEALAMGRTDPWAVVDAIREGLRGTGVAFEDSTPLVREDRSR